jgi:hypothetical protein
MTTATHSWHLTSLALLAGCAAACAEPAASTTSQTPRALAATPTPTAPPVAVDAGAFDAGATCEDLRLRCQIPYDIHDWNCHHYAAACVTDNPSQTVGVVACAHRPLWPEAGHTVNWVRYLTHTCIVEPQDGSQCCWQTAPDAPMPPDISSGDGARCAEAMCGDQYVPPDGGIPLFCEQTQCWPVHRLPRIPMALDCAVENQGDQASCLACCDDRGNMWDDGWVHDDAGQPIDGRVQDRDGFVMACRFHCGVPPW